MHMQAAHRIPAQACMTSPSLPPPLTCHARTTCSAFLMPISGPLAWLRVAVAATTIPLPPRPGIMDPRPPCTRPGRGAAVTDRLADDHSSTT